MSATSAVPTQDFTSAKAHFSDVMTAVVAGHQPHEVVRRGKEAMVLLNRDDLARTLEHFSFSPTVVLDEGEVTVEVPEVGILGFGAELEEAVDDALEELRAYTQRFFDKAAFYLSSDRARHAPWLLRFALTPPEAQRELLEARPAA
jgi:prevent-host-death family protein